MKKERPLCADYETCPERKHCNGKGIIISGGREITCGSYVTSGDQKYILDNVINGGFQTNEASSN